MEILYTSDCSDLCSADLEDFFVGWPDPPRGSKRLAVLTGSSEVVLAREAQSGKVVGFITAVSDGALAAYIPLLEVLPTHQGRGVGKELVRRMLLALEPYYMVDLLCDASLVPFYESLGLSQLIGMARRNYPRQSGV